MKHSGKHRCVVLYGAMCALGLACMLTLGGCARASLNGWAQNSPVIQPLPPVVHLGAKAEQ